MQIGVNEKLMPFFDDVKTELQGNTNTNNYSYTSKTNVARLELQTDKNLVLYDNQNRAKWSLQRFKLEFDTYHPHKYSIK